MLDALQALVVAVATLAGGSGPQAPLRPPVQPPAAAGAGDVDVARIPARRKAALVVVSGLPAPARVGGVILFAWSTDEPRPASALVYTDQEGGSVKRYPDLPPFQSAASFRTTGEAFVSGRATGRALREIGVHVDFAPVLDAPDGPLGTRHFARPELGVAFGRGLGAGGAGACAKHFPGLGSTPESTDVARVSGVVRAAEVAAFRAGVDAGLPCVMVGHAIYPRLGKRPASLEPETYRLLRGLGFDGIAITDSLDPLGVANAPANAVLALRAGADLVLVPHAGAAERAIAALVPLARSGALDRAVERVIAWRRSFGLPALP